MPFLIVGLAIAAAARMIQELDMLVEATEEDILEDSMFDVYYEERLR